MCRPVFCGLYQDEEELNTVEHIVCHCLRLGNLRFKWLCTQFHDRLDDIPVSGLSNINTPFMGQKSNSRRTNVWGLCEILLRF